MTRASASCALKALGAEVRVFADADNCVRRREPGEPCERPEDDPASLPFVIEVQGVPNLLHELAHVVLLGRVERDHATEYAKIPFDLASAAGRRLLLEEIACCAASSRFHPGGDDDARDWFVEQVGIQGLFFGFERDPEGFVAAAGAQLSAHRAELDAVIERASAGVESALRRGGAPDAAARPRRAAALDGWWREISNLTRDRSYGYPSRRFPGS